jgi:hypothetical protein
MLNSILVEQFAGIHRQKKSGVLTVVGPGLRLRFCIEDGDPVGLDFCADKDLVLGQALLDSHKIGPEVYQMAVESRRLGKGTVAETVRRQQVVNEDEIAQVTRSMVEDTLVKCFGTPHQELVFDERDDSTTFDFDNSAVRLRIGTEILLNTVQARVAEVDRVMQEVGGPDAVFSLSENEAGSAPLSEFEKHVLNFIDGRKTVEEIAIAFRESTLTMSRLLHGMAAKGVIKRSSIGGISRLRAAVQQPTPDTPTAAVPASAPALPDFVPHRAAEPPRSNRAVLAMLIAALVLVSAIGYLVILSQRRSVALDSAAQALIDNLVAGKWDDAVAQIDKARSEAGNDVVAIERVQSLDQRLQEALKIEHAAIAKLIEAQDYLSARDRLGRLPAALQPVDLRNDLQRGLSTFNNRSDALLGQVTNLLANGQAAQAMRVIAGAKGKEGEAAADHLARWRLSSLERAASSSLPLSQREALVNQILATEPDSRQREQIQRIQGDFARLQKRTTEQIAQLQTLAAKGDFLEVENQWDQARISDQVRGTQLAGKADALKRQNDQVAKEMRALEADGLALITDSDDPKAMGAYAARVQQALDKWPLASNAAALQANAQLLNELSGLVAERQAGDEATALSAWLLDRQPPAAVTALVQGRAKRLQGIEDAATKALETARAFARQNDWEANERLLRDLLARPQWQRTVAYGHARRDLESISTIKSQQQAWQEELRKAMLAGDSQASLAIAQRMGLRYLPLVVHSQPAGADVVRDGKSIGTTPLIIDLPAGERANLVLRVQRPDFDPVEVKGANAEGGWFLPVRLERTASARFDLAQTLTARPTAVGNRLWVASRQAAAVLAPGQAVQRYAFEHAGTGEVVGQPLYAGALATTEGVWYPTRDGIAIRVGKSGIERLPLAGRTDLGMIDYTSELIVGRRFLIVAGLDGALHAGDERNPLAAWHGPGGAAFAHQPVLRGDRVLALRGDGTIEVHLADDGTPVGRHRLDGEVLGAWHDAQGLHAVTRTSHWRYDGMNDPVRTALPQEIRSAGREVLITPDNHAWVLVDGTWRDAGRLDGRPTAQPIHWSGHAVIPLGTRLLVLGTKGFQVAESSEFLVPEVVAGHLAVATMAGVVRFYAP